MTMMTRPLLFAALLLAAHSALPQETGPGESIRKATWEAYRQYYPSSPLCAKDEITLWSCSAGKRESSLCSSHVLTRTQGHMQYRASEAGKKVFAYPADKHAPAGRFAYTSYANGDASVEFMNHGYRYSLVDSLRGESSIRVEAPGGKTTHVACDGNQTLQLNYTMRLMYDAGLWDR